MKKLLIALFVLLAYLTPYSYNVQAKTHEPVKLKKHINKPTAQIKKIKSHQVKSISNAQKNIKKQNASYSVLVKRVRWCLHPVNFERCGLGITSPDFKEWQKVQPRVQQDTYIAPISIPPRDKIENVVFIAAGQQIEPDISNYGDGYPNVLTGQPDNFKNKCKMTRKQCWRRLDNRSLAVRLINSGKFNLDKTLFIVALDARIQWEKSKNERQDIENAYWNYLTKQFDPGKVRQIVLAGQSRGGCLAYRLGKRFRNTYPFNQIPLIVEGFDPVCHRDELGLLAKTNLTYGNPLNPLYNSIVIDMNKVFAPQRRQYLALLDIHAGARVKPFDVRSFTFKPNDIDLTWWKQKWVNFEHTDMGGNFAHQSQTVIPGYQFIMNKTKQFSSYQPPGTLPGANHTKCPVRFPKLVGTYLDGNPVCRAFLVNRMTETQCRQHTPPGRVWNDYCVWKKKRYWHARTLKLDTSGQLKCSARFPKRVGTYRHKPVCRAIATNKLTINQCSKKKGMKWNGYCLFGKKYLWHARTLKEDRTGQLKCSARFPKRLGAYKNKPVCRAILENKITAHQCAKKNGMRWNSYCLFGKKYLWHARTIKTASCPRHSNSLGFHNGKPVCRMIPSRKIKEKKCGKNNNGFIVRSECYFDKGSYYKARELK